MVPKCGKGRASAGFPVDRELQEQASALCTHSLAMNVRSFVDADADAVYSIQRKCPQAAEWHAEDYLRLARDPGGTILVAEMEVGGLPELAGFAVFYRVMDEAELRNIAIDPLRRRQGMARALLEAGIRRMQNGGALRLFLEVRVSNQPALAFYAASGFKLLYTRRGYYNNPVEDALVLACDIMPSSSPPLDPGKYGKVE